MTSVYLTIKRKCSWYVEDRVRLENLGVWGLEPSEGRGRGHLCGAPLESEALGFSGKSLVRRTMFLMCKERF